MQSVQDVGDDGNVVIVDMEVGVKGGGKWPATVWLVSFIAYSVVYGTLL